MLSSYHATLDNQMLDEKQILLDANTHIHTHTHKCTFQNFPHFPIFPFSSIFSNLLELWILQPHESSSQLILQEAELFLPSPAQTEDPTEKGSVVFKLLSYKVVCYIASDD